MKVFQASCLFMSKENVLKQMRYLLRLINKLT